MADGAIADHRLSHVSTASSTNSKRAKAHIGPWQLGRTLGRGSSGRVRLAKHTETGKLAAVKIVPKSQIMDLGAGTTSKASESFGIEREVIIMKLIEHPNIMTLYDVWENKGELYLVLEYIEGGELFDYLISRGRLSEREAIHYFRQICYGVDYCHKFNICHRDLKPENLLLDKHRNIKIADFGMAALESNGRLLETSCGSPHYASPEIVTGKTYHGAPSDIWSCGIILFALLTGHLPFDDDNIRQLLLKVQAGKYTMPSSLSIEARDLISKMLVVNPTKRISMQGIFAHPLFTKYPLRRVPIENIDRRTPKVDVTQPIVRIDPEILRNLQTLWHHDTREYIVQRLRQAEPNTEKTFYSLLLRFRQRHGLASRESLPRNRSVASIRSLRSSKSIRSIASLNSRPGSIKSLKSVRSNRSARSLLSRRVARYSPVKQHPNHHHRKTSSFAYTDSESAAKHTAAKPLVSKKPATNSENTDGFAQLLDQAFNHKSQNQYPHQNQHHHYHQHQYQPSTDRSQASVATATPGDTNTATASAASSDAYHPSVVDAAYPATITPGNAVHSTGPKSYLGQSNTADSDRRYSDQSVDTNKRASTGSTSTAYTFDFDFPQGTTNYELNAEPADPQSNYLLPMIFEEDRFADAIEEEMDMKLYKRNQSQTQFSKLTREQQNRRKSQQGSRHALGQTSNQPSLFINEPIHAKDGSTSSSSSSGQLGDNSQLRIHNLVAGESFLSYQPSPAAASISAPVRPAPKAPTGPRVMSQRKAVPIYVESDAESTHEDVKPPARQPLVALSPENLKQQPNTTAKPNQPDQLKIPKRGAREQPATNPSDTGYNKQGQQQPEPHKEKKSWIRRLTPRLVSRKSSKPEADRQNVSKPPTTVGAGRQQQPTTNANKENELPQQSKRAQDTRDTKRDHRQTSFEEPRQNWFMKFLTSASQNSSRTIMSSCQPIELRAIILELLSEWMPHGLALYSDGARGEPISVAILRNNSLKLKSARVSIDIKPSLSSVSAARLVHEHGSRTSFFTFAGELERRLGENNVLGV